MRDDSHDGNPSPTPVRGYAATLDELAKSIGLPGETLEALNRKGKGPPTFKLGRRIFCRITDFHEWLDDVATGKIEATLNPSKRRQLRADEPPRPIPRLRRQRGESRAPRPD